MTEYTISPEIHFCQQLASNQKKVRDRCLKKLKKYLISKSSASDAFTENSMLTLWKGLYYFFWMCDKPLVQEEIAEEISKLIYCFQKFNYSLLFIDTFFQTMSREWYGMDRYRIEKFMMLSRKFLHRSFEFLMTKKWNIRHIKRFGKVVTKSASNPIIGFQLHVIDMYLEELVKVGGKELSAKLVRHFLVPYSRLLIETKNSILLKSICKNIFHYLINQEEDDDGIFFLKFNSKAIQRMLMKLEDKAPLQRNKRAICTLVKSFKNYSRGAYAYDDTPNRKIKGPSLRNRDVLRACTRLCNMDEAFRQEKLSYKKNKGLKKANVDDDLMCDYEDVLM